MTNKPLLSFVIPVYQKPPEVFEKCLESLFDQSLKEIEVICVFDGADEALHAVTTKFPKVKIIVIEHGGAPRARNAGLSVATGTYVVFWDADCYIKPGTAKRWIEEFEAIPDADFVFTGYEITHERPGLEGEPFDPYSLTCGNYISSMSPIKREKAFEWDETLPAGQDWDYWLTASEKGYKGVFIQGSGFVTDLPESGISSVHWSAGNRDKTIYTIREKHGIPKRDIAVYSMSYGARASKLAKILNADLFKPTGPNIENYRMLINIGYSYLSRFEEIAPHVVKIQYWLPGEIEALKEAKYQTVMETIRVSKAVINLCNTQYEQNRLSELGITAEVVELPLGDEDITKVSKELPEEFSILIATDESYGELLKDIQIDLPHIKFGFKNGLIKEYSCFMSFYQFASVDEAMKTALVNGRHVISNVQAPFTGFIDPDQSWDKFKDDLYQKIREVRGKPLNREAQAYYLQLADPEKFRKVIQGYLTPKLEIVNA